MKRSNENINNPFSESISIKKSKKLPSFLSFEEMERFFNSPTENFIGARDKFLFELLYSTGCRVSEICSLNINDIRGNQIRIKGKGNKERIVFVGESALEAYRKYKPLRDARSIKNDKRALFLDFHGKRLTVRGVHYLVRKYSLDGGIGQKGCPGTFRPNFCNACFQ